MEDDEQAESDTRASEHELTDNNATSMEDGEPGVLQQKQQDEAEAAAAAAERSRKEECTQPHINEILTNMQ